MKRIFFLFAIILLSINISFGQQSEIKKAYGTKVISIPTGVSATGYDSHIDITWNANSETNIIG